MDFSISQALYDWMHDRRIVAAVANEMGMDASTLSAELRPSCRQAKLGADTLIKLCQTVRRLGYGRELDGILHQMIHAMREPQTDDIERNDMAFEVRTLTKNLGVLADVSDHILDITEEAELVRLGIIVRTEVFPTVMQIESIIETQLDQVRSSRSDLAADQA